MDEVSEVHLVSKWCANARAVVSVEVGSPVVRHEKHDGRNRHDILHRTWRKTVPRLTGTSIAEKDLAGRSALSLSMSMFVSECSRRPPAREAKGKQQADVAFTHRLRNRRICAKRERSLCAHDRSGIRGAPCPRRNVLGCDAPVRSRTHLPGGGPSP